MQFRFAEIEINSELYELRLSGNLVSVEPKVFDLLLLFVENPNKLFTKNDLIEKVWSGRIISDSSISNAVKIGRKVIGDDGTKQKHIKTVHGRGFRFITKVEVIFDDAIPLKPLMEITDTVTNDATKEIPSLIILPFTKESKAEEVVEFGRVVVSDIETILSRIPLLQISSLGTQYNSEDALNITKIHQETGVHYIIEGSVKLKNNGIKINIKFSDARRAVRLWSENFVGSLSDEDPLVTEIISKLEPQIYQAIYKNNQSTNDKSNSRELYLKASSLLALKGWHANTFQEATDLLRKSEALDQNFALAPAYLSLILSLGYRIGLLSQDKDSEQEAVEAAERAMALDGLDSIVLGFSGCALADLGLVDRALPILKNAIQRHSSNAQAWVGLGAAYVLLGKYQTGIKYLSHGIDISPLDPRLSLWGSVLAIAYIRTESFNTAHQMAEKACQSDANSYIPRVVLAAANLCCNKPDAAKNILSEAYRVKPDLSTQEIGSLIGIKLTQQLLS